MLSRPFFFRGTTSFASGLSPFHHHHHLSPFDRLFDLDRELRAADSLFRLKQRESRDQDQDSPQGFSSFCHRSRIIVRDGKRVTESQTTKDGVSEPVRIERIDLATGQSSVSEAVEWSRDPIDPAAQAQAQAPEQPEAQAPEQPEVQDPDSSPLPTVEGELTQQLARLAHLHASGSLTTEEFNQGKRLVLGL